MVVDGAGSHEGHGPWSWVAFGVIVGVVSVGLGGSGLEAGVGYGALGGLVAALVAGRLR